MGYAQFVEKKPRPPVVMAPQQPCDAKSVWTGDRWQWNPQTERYDWLPGKCIPIRKGYQYHPGQWRHTEQGWVWDPGRWERLRIY